MTLGRTPTALVFAGTTTLVLVLVAVNGGTFDIVGRQELAILVWVILGAGWSFGFLPRAAVPRPLAVGVVGAALLCIVCGASLAWTESAERTLADLTRDTLYLGVVGLVVSVLTRRTAPWVGLGCLLASGIVLALAVFSRLSPGLFPANDIGRIFETVRLSYPLNYWNALGAYAAMAAGLGLAWAAHARMRWQRFAALAVVPVAASVIFLTYSRAGVVGLVVAAAVVLGFARHRVTVAVLILVSTGLGALAVRAFREHRELADAKGTAGAGVVVGVLLAAALIAGMTAAASRRIDHVRVPRRFARPALATLGVGALLVAAVAGPPAVSAGWSQFSKPVTTLGNDPVSRLGTLSGYRYDIYDSALRAFVAHPVGGTGSGTFEFWFDRTGGIPQLRDAHSLVLEPMAELGIPGLLATLVMLGGLGAAALLACRRGRGEMEIAAALGGLALLTVWFVQGAVDWIWEVPAVTLLALVGTCAGSMVVAADAHRRPGRVLRILFGALAIVVVLIQLPGISSTRYLRSSVQAGKAARLDEAAVDAEKAIRAEPWSSEAWAQLAVVDEAAGRSEQAVRRLGRAQALEPTNWRWPFLRARVLVRVGRPDAAVASLRRAKELRPNSPFLRK